jgi:secreted Zn-dependent insulinase-like peptidase
MVVDIIMKYIELFSKNIDNPEIEKLYEENLSLIKYTFNHFEKKSCVDFISEINSTLTNYEIEPEKILLLDTMQDTYEKIKNNLKNLIKTLTINNCVTIICSDKYSDKKYEKKILEFPHYGTKYLLKNKQFDCSENIGNMNDINIELPKSNEYISIDENINKYTEQEPKFIQLNNAQIYFQQNTEYNTPDIIIYLRINIKLSLYDVYTFACTSLYLSSLIREANDVFYLFLSALYDISLDYSEGNIYLKITGNHKKINNVLETIIKKILNFNLISEKSFSMTKFEIKKICENDLFSNPYEKVSTEFKKYINSSCYSPDDILKIIDKINLDDVKNVFKTIFIRNNILAYISGNCDNNNFEMIKKTIMSIPSKNHDFTNFYDKKINDITKETLSVIKNKNEIEENNANGYYVFIDKYDYKQINSWIKDYCCLNLLHNIISTEYFDQLRTKETFGYVVNSRLIQIGSKITPLYFYCFLVQSPHKSTDEITKRTKKFISDFSEKIKNLSMKEIETIKNSYITTLLSKFNNFNEYCNNIFNNEIETNYLNYNLREVIAESCKKIKKQDLIDFFKIKFLNNDRVLILQIKKN